MSKKPASIPLKSPHKCLRVRILTMIQASGLYRRLLATYSSEMLCHIRVVIPVCGVSRRILWRKPSSSPLCMSKKRRMARHHFRLFSPDNISLKQFYDAAGIGDFRYAGFQVAMYPLKVKKASASFETLLQATADSKWFTFKKHNQELKRATIGTRESNLSVSVRPGTK